MRINQKFGQVLKRHRIAAKLSQEALAAKANVHRVYVGSVERGKSSISLDVADRLAMALGVHLSELIREAEGRL